MFYTLAGPEISVATTKAYSAQLAAMYCLAVQFAKVREKITEEQYSYYISELLTLPEKMQKTLEDKERIQWFAAKYANAHDVFFVGRGIDYAVCLEGSLKLKEISYIHSEAYAAGELKHGTISLIERGTLVIGVLTQSELYEKTISNMLECKSRGAYLMGLTTYGKYVVYVHVMFNNDLKRIVVRGCDENDKDALRWCVAKPDKRKSRKMSCKPFATLVYQKMGWDSECRYKMLGYRITFEGETLYVFDLLVPEIFHEGQRKKNAVDSQDNAASTKPVNSRKGFYLDDIVGTFGVPVEEHRKESEVKQMDGYVSMGILTGKIAPEAGKD